MLIDFDKATDLTQENFTEKARTIASTISAELDQAKSIAFALEISEESEKD